MEEIKLHLEMSAAQDPSDENKVLMRVATTAPLRKEIVPPEMLAKFLDDKEINTEDVPKEVLIKHLLMIRTSLERQIMEIGMEEGVTFFTKKLIFSLCRTQELVTDRDVWLKVPQLIRYGQNGEWALTLGEYFDLGTKEDPNPEGVFAGFAPALAISPEGICGFAPLFVRSDMDFSFPTEEDWMVFCEKWNIEDLEYMRDTVNRLNPLEF